MKQWLRKHLPWSWLSVYHRVLTALAAVWYRHPSRELIVVGITGTKGKSTTGNVLWKILTDAGHTVGLTGTLNIRIGNHHELSPYKMTMYGRFALQRLLRRMVRAGCDVAIVETTSEGIRQWRHQPIHYDRCAFTNLTPEHIEVHGGFEQYKQAKLELFCHLARLPVKELNGQRIEKATIANVDNEHAVDFLAIGDWKKVTVGSLPVADVVVKDIAEDLSGTSFTVNGVAVRTPLLGHWNARNAALAMGIGLTFGLTLEQMAASVAALDQLPGRMERVDAGQPFTVIVDYAYEPVSAESVYRFVTEHRRAGSRIIAVTGGTGGGRDKARWPVMGELAGRYADSVVVTDDDPYMDDRMTIINTVADGAARAGKSDGQNLFRVLGRREGIAQALQLAESDDVVLVLGKGSEQQIAIGSQLVPWDDREAVRELLQAKQT